MRWGSRWALVGSILTVSVSSCVLVMDADFDRYEAAPHASDSDAAGTGGATGDAQPDGTLEAAAGSSGDAMGGAAGGSTGGTAGSTGGTAGGSTGGTGGGPSCDDQIRNQGEEGVDCGGPCPPCPVVGFTHFEGFNEYPGFSPDGPYTVSGICEEDPFVAGWEFTNEPDSTFGKASGYYAMILTDKLLYVDFPCDDSLISPALNTHGATQITVEFDSSLAVLSGTTASLWLVRDGSGEQVWTRTITAFDEHVSVGPLPASGAATVRVFFRYEAEFDLYWQIDNVRVEGK